MVFILGLMCSEIGVLILSLLVILFRCCSLGFDFMLKYLIFNCRVCFILVLVLFILENIILFGLLLVVNICFNLLMEMILKFEFK